MPSVLQESRVNRINLLELEGARLLVVVHLLPEYERTTTLRLEKKFSPEVISRAENLINRIVGGKTIEEAKESLDSVVRDNDTQNIQEKATNTGVKLSSTGILAFVFIAVVISLAAGAFSFVLFNQLAQNKNELDALKVEIGGQLNGKLDGVSGKFNNVSDRFTNVSDRISRFNDEVKNINKEVKQQNTNFNQSVHKLDTTINQKFTKLDTSINQKIQHQDSITTGPN